MIALNAKKIVRIIEKDYQLYLMLLPAIVGFIIFHYIPIINSLLIGFVKYDILNGFWGSKWVGFKYFNQFFSDIYFFRLIRNTFLLGFFGLIWGTPPPIILALLFNEIRNRHFKKITQSISYLPHFISTVVIIGILNTIFGYDGIVNFLLAKFGFEPVGFISFTKWFRTLYIGSSIWQSVGWGAILYIASLNGVDVELYDAAVIDGAGRWHKNVHINLPAIAPTFIILLILNVGSIINVGFEKVYLMYSPPIYEVADVISTYVYRRGIQDMDYGYAGAVSLFNSAVSIVLLVTSNFVCRKTTEGSSLW